MLLDVDPEISEWSCLPESPLGEMGHIPDFRVARPEGVAFVDAVPRPCNYQELERRRRQAASTAGHGYETFSRDEIREDPRLGNAKDLLRYARWECPLGDRVRLVAALDDAGSMSVADCCSAFREVPPIAGLSSLALHHFVEIELDEVRISPETAVRRCDR